LDKTLNILFLCSWYPSRVLPTNGDFVQRHAEAVAIQHKVTIAHVISDKKAMQNIEITDEIINTVRTLIAYVKPTKNPIIKYFRFKKAYKLLLKKIEKIDVVHANVLFPVGKIALELKQKKDIPYIITEHHSIYHKPYNKEIGIIEKYYSKRIVKNASIVAPVSNDLAKSMQNYGLKGNYETVPNVIDTSLFSPKKEQTKKQFTLLHVSNMVGLKNVNGILRVVKKLETKLGSFHFYFIGGQATEYEKQATELAINLKQVTFINHIAHKELISYFQKADVFVLFSDIENLPCVIPEAFSCGTPVISSNVGGISEYFPDDFGILVAPNNEEQLLDAIVKLHTNYKVKSPVEMHEYVVANFSKAQISKAFTELYLQVLS